MDPIIARNNMIREQIAARGITDPRILQAFSEVPRHRFVDDYLKYKAYEDYPLTIGLGQTISQPYMVALMTAATPRLRWRVEAAALKSPPFRSPPVPRDGFLMRDLAPG